MGWLRIATTVKVESDLDKKANNENDAKREMNNEHDNSKGRNP